VKPGGRNDGEPDVLILEKCYHGYKYKEPPMKYAGLTDDPETSRSAHGKPSDWSVSNFKNEKEARRWEKDVLARPGYSGKTGGKEWKFGFIYTITNLTTQ
jgi:hypothetical protein